MPIVWTVASFTAPELPSPPSDANRVACLMDCRKILCRKRSHGSKYAHRTYAPQNGVSISAGTSGFGFADGVASPEQFDEAGEFDGLRVGIGVAG